MLKNNKLKNLFIRDFKRQFLFLYIKTFRSDNWFQAFSLFPKRLTAGFWSFAASPLKNYFQTSPTPSSSLSSTLPTRPRTNPRTAHIVHRHSALNLSHLTKTSRQRFSSLW